MTEVTIGEFKRRLPELLEAVARGESVVLQRGHRRENVAVLGPYPAWRSRPRRLGPLARRGAPVFNDWEIGETEFLEGR